MFAIRLRLLRILLASPPLPVRLGLSWLSCSPPPDLPAVAEVVNPGSACRQTEAPHASRVERTRAAAQVRSPRTGFLDGCGATVVARSSKSPALCAAATRHRNSPQHVKLLHRRGLVLRRGGSASPVFSRVYWIERRDYSDTGRFSVTEGACDRRDYFDEPPLNWANTSPRTQLEGPARMGSRQSSRSLSSVVQIETQLACGGLAELEQQRIPDDAPGPRRVRADRQAVAQQAEAHGAVFPANRIVEPFVLISDSGQPTQCVAEQPIALAAFRVGGDQSQLSQAEMRCRLELGAWIGLGEGQGQQASQVELVSRRQTRWAIHDGPRRPRNSVRVRVAIIGFVAEVFAERSPRVQRTQCVLDQGKLAHAQSSRRARWRALAAGRLCSLTFPSNHPVPTHSSHYRIPKASFAQAIRAIGKPGSRRVFP